MWMASWTVVECQMTGCQARTHLTSVFSIFNRKIHVVVLNESIASMTTSTEQGRTRVLIASIVERNQ